MRTYVLSQPKKRVFVGLLTVSLMAIILLLGAIWYLTVNRANILQNFFMVSIVGILIAGILIISFGIGGIVLTIWRSKSFPKLQGSMRVAINLLFPVAIRLGKVWGINKDLIQSSFVEVNNKIVLSKGFKFKPEEIMLLTPHCIQKHECPYKITVDINNCRRCGQCSVDDLLTLREKYGTNVVVASGGTLARKFIQQYRPKAIIAIACERDLASGILDTNPLPVLGVLNLRPNGPCYNTGIEVAKVEEAIAYYLEGSNG
jgi:uncharacterized protein